MNDFKKHEKEMAQLAAKSQYIIDLLKWINANEMPSYNTLFDKLETDIKALRKRGDEIAVLMGLDNDKP